MGLFDGCLLVSDIDGTLMCDGKIPQRNMDAIQYFKAEGGLFTIASGRAPDGILPIYSALQCNAPVISNNGAILYDFSKEELLYVHYLPDHVKNIVDGLMQEFPTVGFIAIGLGEYYVLHRNFGVDMHKRYIHVQDQDISVPESKNKNWIKLLMITDNERQTNALCHFAEKAGYNEEVYFIKSDPTYLEMTDISVSKGAGITQLVQQLNHIEHVYTIGDYDNDLEMLKIGEISSAVAESPDIVKQTATIVSGPCAQGAVADFIAYLKQLRLCEC